MRRRWYALALVILVVPLVPPPEADAAPRVVTIQAGARHPTNPSAPYEYTRYYPETLRVHRGQTVRWSFVGFHTVTFSRSARPPWFRADEIPGTYAVDERFGFGATDCGRDGLRPCRLRPGTRFLSSGAPRTRGGQPFELTVDARPGRYSYFCTVHPSMKGTIEVVGDRAPVPAQKQIDAQIKSAVRADSKTADSLFRADQTPRSSVGSDGRRTWRVLLGDSTPDNHVSILAYLPSELKVAAGDKVLYAFRDRTVDEVHTVTFPTEVAGGTSPAPHGLGGMPFIPACDFDGRTTGMKGVPGLWGVAAWPACPANAEILHAPWMTQGRPAPGDQIVSPATYHDSGMLLPKRSSKGMRVLPDTGRALPASFVAEFPVAGRFGFACNLHADIMSGSVAVS